MRFDKSRTGILVSAPRGVLEPCLDFQTIESESKDIRESDEKSLFSFFLVVASLLLLDLDSNFVRIFVIPLLRMHR